MPMGTPPEIRNPTQKKYLDLIAPSQIQKQKKRQILIFYRKNPKKGQFLTLLTVALPKIGAYDCPQLAAKITRIGTKLRVGGNGALLITGTKNKKS